MLFSEERKFLTQDLNQYGEWWLAASPVKDEETPGIVADFIQLINHHENCFSREKLDAHVTASGFIVNADFTSTLLTHHRKLNDWLQLGGHADGDPVPFNVALKECQEESGLSDFTFVNLGSILGAASTRPLIFDLDKHLIPARKEDPEHYHYDIRYLVQTDETVPLLISEESKDLRWWKIQDAYDVARQRSMHRPFRKIEYLASKLSR